MPQNDPATFLHRRLLAGVLACALVVPAPAFAQGAGDDQYKDPFPETTAQDAQSGSSTTSTSSQGLSDTPPTTTTTGSSTSSGSGTASGTASGEAQTTTTESQAASLARTGDDPWLIALAGASLLLLGAGLRLRSGAQRRH